MDPASDLLAAAPWLHSAFFRFTPLGEATALMRVQAALQRIGADAGVTGSLVVAPEGLSGAVAGREAAVAAFERALQEDDSFADAFRGLAFKHSRGHTPPYARLAVVRKPELVALGVAGVSPLGDAAEPNRALDATAWREVIARDDVVLIDNRNRFEHRLGRFRGAIAPPVDHFHAFADWVRAQAPAWRAANRPVAMYCTGGIRCDKTLGWMRAQGLDVVTLAGGILQYLAEAADSEAVPADDPAWEGACYVFDNRLAVDARLQQADVTPEQVFDRAAPNESWRLARALRLQASAVEPLAVDPAPASR